MSEEFVTTADDGTLITDLNADTDLYEQAAEKINCRNCGKGAARRMKLVLFRYGYASPLGFCSWSCLARHVLDKVVFHDE